MMGRPRIPACCSLFTKGVQTFGLDGLDVDMTRSILWT
jgi:chitinase